MIAAELLEIRCASCSRKLGEGEFTVLRIKCPRCGTLNALTHQSRDQIPDTQHAAERPSQEDARGRARLGR